MMNIVSKSANLAPYLKTSTQSVASQLKPLVAPVVVAANKNAGQPSPVPTTSYSLGKSLPNGSLTVRAGPAGKYSTFLPSFHLYSDLSHLSRALYDSTPRNPSHFMSKFVFQSEFKIFASFLNFKSIIY